VVSSGAGIYKGEASHAPYLFNNKGKLAHLHISKQGSKRSKAQRTAHQYVPSKAKGRTFYLHIGTRSTQINLQIYLLISISPSTRWSCSLHIYTYPQLCHIPKQGSRSFSISSYNKVRKK